MDNKEKLYLESLVEKFFSRRDFLRYSSIALMASAIPKVIGCSTYQPRQDCQRQIYEGQKRIHQEIFKSSLLSNIKLKNRIIRSATTQGLGDKQGRPTDALAEIYAELSQGGVGAIITGLAAVQKNGAPGIPGGLMIDKDEYIDDYKKLSKLVHRDNTPIIMQIAHCGRQTRRAITGEGTVAPSAITDNYYNEETPRELTELEIKEIIENFILAIDRARKAGFDGVQLHAAHGYLLSEFLSPNMNQRTDKWGGTIENRFRIIKEIYKGARKRVGDYPIIIKVSAYDYQANGLRVEETIEIASMLQDVGCDGIEVSCGVVDDGFSAIRVPELPVEPALRYSFRFKNQYYIVKKIIPFIAPLLISTYEPINNYNVCAAQEIKRNVDIPIIVVGGIRKLNDIEQIIGGNMADYVAMSRPFIIEPDIVNKFRTQSQTSSECISCGYCIVALEEVPAQCFYGQLS
jgi:2,4-dienoyl-CoA reductase-like NADH-dependent reductase (Old Yellow Enzyme family)